MTCRTWWIMASISFLVSIIMSACSHIFSEAAIAVYFVALMVGFVVAGWVLWAVGLVSYLKWR